MLKKICLVEDVRDYYYVSDDGRVYSDFYGDMKELAYHRQEKDNGYITIRVCLKTNNNTKKNFTVARLVAKSFIKNDDNLPEVDHIDRDSTNNNVSNLRWVDRSSNSRNRTFGWKVNRIFKIPINVYTLEKEYICTVNNSKDLEKYKKEGSMFNISRAIVNRKQEYYKHNGYLFNYFKEGVETKGDECSPVGK